MRISVRIDSKAAQAQLRRWGGEFRDKVKQAVARGIAIGRAVLVASSRVDVAHYFIDPSQVRAEWERLRDVAKAKAGARFDPKAFHDVLLRGAMPLVVLEQVLSTMTFTA